MASSNSGAASRRRAWWELVARAQDGSSEPEGRLRTSASTYVAGARRRSPEDQGSGYGDYDGCCAPGDDDP